MKYNKKSLAEKISKDHSMPYAQAYKFIGDFLLTLQDIFKEEGESGVTFTNFFTLKTLQRKARKGINPVTQNPMTIKARKSVHAKVSPILLKELNTKRDEL